MDSIDKISYRDSKKKFKKLSNEKLIMEALKTLLNDVSELINKTVFFGRTSVTTQALKEELQIRVQKENNDK